MRTWSGCAVTLQTNIERGSVYVPLAMMAPALGPAVRRLANVMPDAKHKELVKVGGWVGGWVAGSGKIRLGVLEVVDVNGSFTLPCG